MIYKIAHRTTCLYRRPVSVGKHVACLRPRSLPGQQLTMSELHIEPSPISVDERVDYFGNLLYFFTVQEPHRKLVVEARSEVRMHARAESIADVGVTASARCAIPWEEALQLLRSDQRGAGLEAYEFSFESPRIKLRPEFAAYALESFTPRRSMLDGLLDLTSRIHRDFRFDSKVTNVRTTTDEVFRKRRGVCQDFAHFQLACLRSLGLPARYVSGYLRTHPPPGQPRLVGADASHAWVSAYCPGAGWIDLDPTNDVVPSTGHVTLAWGRDYGDVSPLYGVIQGGGEHILNVSVDVEEVES
jgi:transglutaminase-like putative cysteine protease